MAMYTFYVTWTEPLSEYVYHEEGFQVVVNRKACYAFITTTSKSRAKAIVKRHRSEAKSITVDPAEW